MCSHRFEMENIKARPYVRKNSKVQLESRLAIMNSIVLQCFYHKNYFLAFLSLAIYVPGIFRKP